MSLLAVCASGVTGARAAAPVVSVVGELVEDAPGTLRVGGEAGVGGARLVTHVLAPGQGDCPSSPVEGARIDELAAGAFEVAVPALFPTAGTYLACAWLSEPRTGGGRATSSYRSVGTARRELAVRAPHAELSLTVAPADAPDSMTGRVVYQGIVEVGRALYATVKSADGGGCGPSFGADLGRSILEAEAVAAPFAGRVEFSDAIAGSAYLVCVWLQEAGTDALALAAAHAVVSIPPQTVEDECGTARAAVARAARVVVKRKARYRAIVRRRKAARTKDGKRRIAELAKVIRESLERARAELEANHDRVEETCR